MFSCLIYCMLYQYIFKNKMIFADISIRLTYIYGDKFARYIKGSLIVFLQPYPWFWRFPTPFTVVHGKSDTLDTRVKALLAYIGKYKLLTINYKWGSFVFSIYTAIKYWKFTPWSPIFFIIINGKY